MNIPSLILDLSTRRLGIDRFEGWSASRLSYILEESQNASIRQNLEKYLHLLIESIQHNINPAETLNPLVTGGLIARRHSRLNQLGLLGSRRKIDVAPRSVELTRLVSLTKAKGKSAEETIDDEHSLTLA